MEFFRIKKDIPFMRHAVVLNAVSAITFLLAVFFLFSRGLHLSIEFTGGTLVEVAYSQTAQIDKVREVVEKLGFGEVQVIKFGTARDVLIRVPVRPGTKQADVVTKVFDALCTSDTGKVSNVKFTSAKGEDVDKAVCKRADGVEPLQLKRSEFVGPSVGAELVTNGLIALGMTVLGIMIYLAIRFEWKYAVAGIIANLHDVVIILGFFAFFQWEFSLAVLAAVLAVLGYSVNESVIIFDRIRESFRKFRLLTPREIIDHHHDHQPHHHYPWIHANHGALDVAFWGANAVLLRVGAHHWHLVWYLLVRVRGCSDCHVAGYQTRRFDQIWPRWWQKRRPQ